MIKNILHAYAFNLMYARKLVADLPDDKMAVQPAPGMNHAAWVIGHLAASTDFVLFLIGQTPPPRSPEWNELFGNSSKPSSDPGRYPAKALLVKELEEGHARVAAAVEKLDAAQLAAPTPHERFAHVCPTVGDSVAFLLTGHESMHLGQLSAWRRVQGLPSVF